MIQAIAADEDFKRGRDSDASQQGLHRVNNDSWWQWMVRKTSTSHAMEQKGDFPLIDHSSGSQLHQGH